MKLTPRLLAPCYALACLLILHPATAQLVVTNVTLASGMIYLSGTGGTNAASCVLLSNPDASGALTGWTPVATNDFDTAGNFSISNATPPGAPS